MWINVNFKCNKRLGFSFVRSCKDYFHISTIPFFRLLNKLCAILDSVSGGVQHIVGLNR